MCSSEAFLKIKKTNVLCFATCQPPILSSDGSKSLENAKGNIYSYIDAQRHGVLPPLPPAPFFENCLHDSDVLINESILHAYVRQKYILDSTHKASQYFGRTFQTSK